jgi:hypothetical protein
MARRSNDRQCVTSFLSCAVHYFQFLLLAVDSVSIYDPPPTLSYFWDPDPTRSPSRTSNPLSSKRSPSSYELGPHPSDPHSIILPTSTSFFSSPQSNHLASGASSRTAAFGTSSYSERVYGVVRVSGQQLWVYAEERGFVILLPSRPNRILTFFEARSRFGASLSQYLLHNKRWQSVIQ